MKAQVDNQDTRRQTKKIYVCVNRKFPYQKKERDKKGIMELKNVSENQVKKRQTY